MKVENETASSYNSSNIQTDDHTVKAALAILERRMKRDNLMDSPEQSYNYVTLKYSEYPQEVFGILILDQKHFLIKTVELFKGTVASCNVHIRDIIRETLKENGAAIICYHNHPSGNLTPSVSDDLITKKIKDACELMEIRLLDHIIVGSGKFYSYARTGNL